MLKVNIDFNHINDDNINEKKDEQNKSNYLFNKNFKDIEEQKGPNKKNNINNNIELNNVKKRKRNKILCC